MTAPMVRVRVVEHLAAHIVPGVRRYKGQVPVDTSIPAIAKDLGISAHDATEAMWTLQKQQIVTFRERKKGNNGHGTLEHIRIADTALNGASPHIIAVVVGDEQVIEKAVANAVDVVSVAQEVGAGAIQTYANTPCKNRKAAPEWCVEHDSMWPRGDANCAAWWEHLNPGPDEETGPGADAQNDASTGPADTVQDDLPVILVPPVLADYPAIQKVLLERRQRDVAADAARRLAEVGLDDLAIPLMVASEPMSALETEVIVLATLLGWLDA